MKPYSEKVTIQSSGLVKKDLNQQQQYSYRGDDKDEILKNIEKSSFSPNLSNIVTFSDCFRDFSTRVRINSSVQS